MGTSSILRGTSSRGLCTWRRGHDTCLCVFYLERIFDACVRACACVCVCVCVSVCVRAVLLGTRPPRSGP